MNFISWLQLTALPTGRPAMGWDLKRWRYRLFATAGKSTIALVPSPRAVRTMPDDPAPVEVR